MSLDTESKNTGVLPLDTESKDADVLPLDTEVKVTGTVTSIGKNTIGDVDVPIRLNLLGNVFIAYKRTLCEGAGKNSIFDKMLNGHFAGYAMVDGAYFIERDPAWFKMILLYMSQGRIILPTVAQDSYLLLEEAKFYGVDKLTNLIKSKWSYCTLCKESCLDEYGSKSCSQWHHGSDKKDFWLDEKKTPDPPLTVVVRTGVLGDIRAADGTIIECCSMEVWTRHIIVNGLIDLLNVRTYDHMRMNNVYLRGYAPRGTHTKGVLAGHPDIPSHIVGYKKTVIWPCCNATGDDARGCLNAHVWSGAWFRPEHIPRFN